MLQYLVVALFITSAFGGALPDVYKHVRDYERDDRVVGGQPADIKDAPWQVAMLRTSGSSFYLSCGGSIIGEKIIASAAHCPSGTTASIWRARGGSSESLSGGQMVEIERFVNHETYGSGVNRYDYDLAIYFTTTAFTLDGVNLKAISLPSQDQSVADGTVALLTGWGSTGSGGGAVGTLRKVNIPIYNQQKCASNYGGNWITDRMICAGVDAGGIDACQGDSGGPLEINNVLVGITSWGNGCALPNYPGVWTRVAVFRQWIDSKIN